MNLKKIIVLLLILITIISTLTVVSAGWFDFLGLNGEPESPLINSSVVISATNPNASTEYAYFYEDSGEYAGAAFYRQWEVNSTFNFDVEKLYEESKSEGSDYKDLDEYKNNLKDKIKNNEVYLYSYGYFVDKNGTRIKTPMNNEALGNDCIDINNTYLSNNDTILTITRSTANSGYNNYNFDLMDLDKIDHVENISFMGIGYSSEDKIPVTYNKLN